MIIRVLFQISETAMLILMLKRVNPRGRAIECAMFSEAREEKVTRKAALEEEREERGLSLGDTRSRVKKYDRLAKKTRTKVLHLGPVAA